MAGLPLPARVFIPKRLSFRPADAPALLAGVIIAVPVISVLVAALFMGGGEAWQHIRDTLMVSYLGGTLGTLSMAAFFMLVFALALSDSQRDSIAELCMSADRKSPNSSSVESVSAISI